jgi:hypothetical protein
LNKCLICGVTTGIHKHHVFCASNRNISERFGFTEYLCYEHHTGNEGVHFNRALDLSLKRKHQIAYETKLILDGMTGEEAREKWLSLIGRNYLED